MGKRQKFRAATLSAFDSTHPPSKSEEAVVMTEAVTVLVFPSAQALPFSKKGIHPTVWSSEPGSAAPYRLPMGF